MNRDTPKKSHTQKILFTKDKRTRLLDHVDFLKCTQENTGDFDSILGFLPLEKKK